MTATLRPPDRVEPLADRGIRYEFRAWYESGYVAWVLVRPDGAHVAWGGVDAERVVFLQDPATIWFSTERALRTLARTVWSEMSRPPR